MALSSIDIKIVTKAIELKKATKEGSTETYKNGIIVDIEGEQALVFVIPGQGIGVWYSNPDSHGGTSTVFFDFQGNPTIDTGKDAEKAEEILRLLSRDFARTIENIKTIITLDQLPNGWEHAPQTKTILKDTEGERVIVSAHESGNISVTRILLTTRNKPAAQINFSPEGKVIRAGMKIKAEDQQQLDLILNEESAWEILEMLIDSSRVSH